MKIEMSRKEILELMQELSEDHWMNERLTNALAEINFRANNNFMENTAVLVKPKVKVEKPFPKVKEDKSILHSINHVYGRCSWETYGYYCNKKVPDNHIFELCDEHIDERCSKCGKQAVHGCPVELQFVCGEPLCNDCDHYMKRTF